MGRRIRDFIKYDYPVLITGFMWCLIEFMMQGFHGDEYYYADILNQMSLRNFIKTYYTGWSARVIHDAVAAVVLHYPYIFFKCVNAFMIMLESILIIKLAEIPKERIYAKFAICGLLCSLPYHCFFDAGFSVTSIYYIWPFTAGVFAIYMCEMERKRGFSFVRVILGIIAVLVSCNMEQVAIIVAGILGLYNLIYIWERKINYSALAEMLAAVAGVLFIILTPGRQFRFEYEVNNSFSEYYMLSFFQKVDMGISTTMENMIYSGDFIWSAIAVLIIIVIISLKLPMIYRIIGIGPAVCIIALGPLQSISLQLYPGVGKIINAVGYYGIIDLTNFELRNKWLPLFFIIIFEITFLLAVYLCFGNRKKTILLTGLLVLGLMSRAVMGFSPTIYSSGNRTFYPMWMTGVILGAFLLAKIENETKEKLIGIFFFAVGVISMFSVSLYS